MLSREEKDYWYESEEVDVDKSKDEEEYWYQCNDCGYDWTGSKLEPYMCPKCGCGDIIEELCDKENLKEDNDKGVE